MRVRQNLFSSFFLRFFNITDIVKVLKVRIVKEETGKKFLSEKNRN
jgi:hypothetical protein